MKSSVRMRQGNRVIPLVGVLVLALAGCGGEDGPPGVQGPQGPDGGTGPEGPPPATSIAIGDGSALTPEQIAALGKLQATITGVTVSSPPVVDFTVLDQHGEPATGLDAGAVRFTFVKLLVPEDETVNGGLPYWQSYINESVEPDQAGGPNVLPMAIQATTESGGELEEISPGNYQYTFTTDVTAITEPLPVTWEPELTHRVGMEIRLEGDGRRPMAPDNPVFDFVPNNGDGTGVTKNVVDTDKCEGCHYEFAFHGGQRKTVEYCVTCHNPGHVDADSGNSLDMGHMVHSIHMGADRPAGAGNGDPRIPYIIYRNFGGQDITFDFGEVHYPQSQTYCETCHEASNAAPDGDNWNEKASVRTCGGCHADGIVAENFDPVTGIPEYFFDHSVHADLDVGVVSDGICKACHLGGFDTAGPPLRVHSRISGDQRFREELGRDFVLEVLDATGIGPGETPVITFKVSHPDGTPYDIVADPQFNDANSALNLYVAWTTDDVYNGDQSGATLGLRDRNRDTNPADGIPDIVPYGAGLPHRMELAALQRDIAANPSWKNPDGSYTVTYFAALPDDISGTPLISLAGHPAAVGVKNADEDIVSERAAAVSAVYFPPGAERPLAVSTDQCQACHKQLQEHGANRNGNVAMCINCHTGDNTVVDNIDGVDVIEGFSLGYMVHSIHVASATYLGGEFTDVHFPQSIENCDTCHLRDDDGNPLYNAARASARAVSTDPGVDESIWTDDTATTATAANCGACHNSTVATAHFESQGAQVNELKCSILGAECGALDGSLGSGLPNGQESCEICHGTGREFETANFHNPGLE